MLRFILDGRFWSHSPLNLTKDAAIYNMPDAVFHPLSHLDVHGGQQGIRSR